MEINGKKVIINRENAHISEVDIAYCELCKRILKEGVLTKNRTGIDSIAIANWKYVFDLQKGFPIAETKDVKAKNFTSEIQWIHQVQSNKISWLQERENPVWDEWMIDKDGIYRVYEQGDNVIDDPEKLVPLKRQIYNRDIGMVEKVPVYDGFGKEIMIGPLLDKHGDPVPGKDGKLRTIKEAIYFGKSLAGTNGQAYGYITNKYHQPQRVEWTLKNNPSDRRMNIILWQEAHLAKAVLPSCVWGSEYTVLGDGKLHASIHQRSADVPLGLPFNISQYALLVSMFSKIAGLEVGTMGWDITNAHIYVNQIEGIEKQLKRYQYMIEYERVINSSSDNDIEKLYEKTKELYEKIHLIAKMMLKEDIEALKMSQRIKLLKSLDAKFALEYEETFERKVCLEHMLTRETPILELASHDSIFEYSTDFVKNKDPYMKENPIGNKELVLKKYHPTPFIKMPIAQ